MGDAERPPTGFPGVDAASRSFGVTLSASQLNALERYRELLCDWNRRMNLTAIRDGDEVRVKHFVDSLSCASMLDFAARESVIDVGTGAGFPGLVLKIAFPHLRVVLLDAVEKRLRFLDRVAADLGLEGVQTVHARAEDAARPGAPGLFREVFDVTTARAVASLRVLSEWTLPFTRVGGCMLAMKGPDVGAEVEDAARALRLLGGGRPEVREFSLPGTDIRRSLVRIPKSRPTPLHLPRRPGTARRSPL